MKRFFKNFLFQKLHASFFKSEPTPLQKCIYCKRFVNYGENLGKRRKIQPVVIIFQIKYCLYQVSYFFGNLFCTYVGFFSFTIIYYWSRQCLLDNNPIGNYMFKVNKRNTKTSYDRRLINPPFPVLLISCDRCIFHVHFWKLGKPCGFWRFQEL